MYFKYNDNELLYLISENDEIAFEMLCDKYTPMVKSRLAKFRIKNKNYDDFFQECMMVIYKCSKNYRVDKGHTFNIYLDVSIQNRIKTLLRDESKYFYGVSLVDIEEIDYIVKQESSGLCIKDLLQSNKISLDSYKKKIIEKYNKGQTIREIAISENKKYQSIYRVVNIFRNRDSDNAFDNPDEKKSVLLYSNLEKLVYKKYCNGYKPKEIAQIYNCEVTIIYNALKRIKMKNKNNVES